MINRSSSVERARELLDVMLDRLVDMPCMLTLSSIELPSPAAALCLAEWGVFIHLEGAKGTFGRS